MKLLRQIVLATALAATAAGALADNIVTYTIDPAHTQVGFSWNHVGFSMPGAVFAEVSGSIEGNQDNPEKSSVTLSIPVKSLDSHVPLLNEHLIESGDYFKSKEFPVITFRSTALRDVNRDAGTFTLVGELTVNGIAREVVLDAKLNKVGAHPFYDNAPAAGFNASTRIKRSDFGMGKYVPVVSDELEVRVTVEAVEAGAFKAAQEKQRQAAAKAKAEKPVKAKKTK